MSRSHPIPDTTEARKDAAAIVAAGGVIAFRTDTFYGLGVDPFSASGLERLAALKGRLGNKPILVVVSGLEVLERVVAEKPEGFNEVAKRFWPGPLTLVLKARSDVPPRLTAGTGTIGVRLPDDSSVREVAAICGGVLTATSANPAGQPPACTASEVQSYFPSGLGLILDGGPATGGPASTVLELSGGRGRLIRDGALGRRIVQNAFQEFGLAIDSA